MAESGPIPESLKRDQNEKLFGKNPGYIASSGKLLLEVAGGPEEI